MRTVRVYGREREEVVGQRNMRAFGDEGSYRQRKCALPGLAVRLLQTQCCPILSEL